MPLLPQDIVHLILDVLGDEVETLECCALVCRAWLRPSRAHLFRDLLIEEESQYDRLITLFDSCPELQTAARNLNVSPRDDPPDDMPSIPDRALTELAPRLLNLYELQMSDLTWSRAHAEMLSLPRLTPSLTSLSLTMCSFPSFTAFVALLAMAPGLRCLDFNWLICTFSAKDFAAGEALFATPLQLDMLTTYGLSNNVNTVAAQVLARLLHPRKLVWSQKLPVDDTFLDAMCEYSGPMITDFHASLRNNSRFHLPFTQHRKHLLKVHYFV
jgi:hypothetical protein